MKLTEFFREELDREVERSRKALREVPEGKYDWKPHERSMIFGYLADMVATIPMWIQMEIERDELDVAPAEGKGLKQEKKETSEALLKALEETAAAARGALEKTSDELEVTCGWARRDRRAALHNDPGNNQPLGTPSRPDDCLPAPHGPESPRFVWPISRRPELLSHKKAQEAQKPLTK
jgi:hypothetical protein